MDLAPVSGGLSAGVAEALYNMLWRPARPFALMASGADAPERRRQRLGLDEPPTLEVGAVRIWLHAASVGEIEAVRPIALGLHEHLPGAALFVTTMTQAGCDAAARRIPGARACWLAPLDHPAVVRSFLRAVAPALVLIAETELWPNYFIQSHRMGARLAIVNGRISSRSVMRYLLMRPLLRTALLGADLILAQSAEDARRFLLLGADPQRVVVNGNTKFGLESATELDPALRDFAASGPLLVAGSTAPGEEQAVVEAFVGLRRTAPDLRLALAPRHLERVAEVAGILDANHLRYVTSSRLKQGDAPSQAPVLMVDTFGDLRGLYQFCTLAFVGGSLFKGRGGQNLGEAAVAGVPVLFGPYHENHLPLAHALLESGGGAVVADSQELFAAAMSLLRDDSLRRAQGARARLAYERLAGGAAAALAAVRALLDSDRTAGGASEAP